MENSQQQPVVQLKGIVKRFGKMEAVKKIDLNIEQGSLVTLLGPSGCGKTTILRMIAGLEHPTEGEIYINGRMVNDIPIHKRNLGMIFQNYALFPHKTIFDNVAFGLKYRNVSKTDLKEKVRNALEMVRLPDVGQRYPSQLSGGQQQRIALARAIVIEPDVLLMDEPLSALDENLREDMRREIDNLQQMLGVTTLFVTHDQREALSMSDKIVVMKDGRLQQEGPPEDVYNFPANRFVADFLGSSNFYPARVVNKTGDTYTIRLESGHEFLSRHPSDWNEGADVELVIRAQKFYIFPHDEVPEETQGNVFKGVIKDRSYMGGEVSYFVDLEGGLSIHVISIVNITALKIGDRVVVDVAPRHCGLLSAQKAGSE
ncbi:ABC transporter ATP-binding protein [Desulfonatronovibrio hydrogenovorans]|uniref:ABC transporter ATP-binding protein n=1 Tax=Desulfonatronovibrio hydrogenovorans TaxID=53245 RepID=UPI00048F2849|nr:ABC transporter ATP-binding protein [Desulfonatronovibrio hydrogenovorans]